MAFAPDDATYLVISPNVALPNTRTLTTDPIISNLQLNDAGPGGALTLTPTLNLLSITEVHTSGLIAFTGSHTFTSRTLASDGSISITNASGVAGNPFLAVIDNTSTQKINVNTGSHTSNRSTVNFISGTNVTISVADNAGLDRTDVTINASGGGGGGGTVTSVAIASPGSTLSVSGSPITTNGTINLDINTVSIAHGGTGQTTKSAAFNALSPMTMVGDLIVGGTAGVATVLPVASSGDILTISGGTPTWAPGPGSVNNWANFPAIHDVVMNDMGTDFLIKWGADTAHLMSLSNAASSGGTSGATYDYPRFQISTSGTTGGNLTGSYFPALINATIAYPYTTPVSDLAYTGNILFGSDTSEHGAQLPTFSQLAIGTVGDVLTVAAGTNGNIPSWQNPSGMFVSGSGTLDPSGNHMVLNSSITSASIVLVSGVGSGLVNPATGPLTVVLNNGVGFTVSGAGPQDSGNGFCYLIVKF